MSNPVPHFGGSAHAVTFVTTLDGTLGPFSNLRTDAKVQVLKSIGLLPKSLMINNPLQKAFQILTVTMAPIFLSGALFSQSLTLSAETPPESSRRAPVEIAAAAPLFEPETPLPLAASGAALPPAAFVAPSVVAPQKLRETHPFWDRDNKILFAACGALATADFFTTRANLASGGRELNPVTRVFSGSTPGLAANFALETGGVIGLSYMFHKAGHHKLERIVSIVNMSGSAGAVVYGLTHR
jgi:hypothetical protein